MPTVHELLTELRSILAARQELYDELHRGTKEVSHKQHYDDHRTDTLAKDWSDPAFAKQMIIKIDANTDLYNRTILTMLNPGLSDYNESQKTNEGRMEYYYLTHLPSIQYYYGGREFHEGPDEYHDISSYRIFIPPKSTGSSSSWNGRMFEGFKNDGYISSFFLKSNNVNRDMRDVALWYYSTLDRSRLEYDQVPSEVIVLEEVSVESQDTVKPRSQRFTWSELKHDWEVRYKSLKSPTKIRLYYRPTPGAFVSTNSIHSPVGIVWLTESPDHPNSIGVLIDANITKIDLSGLNDIGLTGDTSSQAFLKKVAIWMINHSVKAIHFPNRGSWLVLTSASILVMRSMPPL